MHIHNIKRFGNCGWRFVLIDKNILKNEDDWDTAKSYGTDEDGKKLYRMNAESGKFYLIDEDFSLPENEEEAKMKISRKILCDEKIKSYIDSGIRLLKKERNKLMI